MFQDVCHPSARRLPCFKVERKSGINTDVRFPPPAYAGTDLQARFSPVGTLRLKKRNMVFCKLFSTDIVFCEKNKKKRIKYKFYLTKWGYFRYIVIARVVESGERWYKFSSGGSKRVWAGMNIAIDSQRPPSVSRQNSGRSSARNYDDRLVITNFDHCLVAFPYEEWSLLEQKGRHFSLMKKETSAFFRFFYSSAMDCDIDKQEGSSSLRPCGLCRSSKGVVLVGEGKRIEIFAKEAGWRRPGRSRRISTRSETPWAT